MHLTTNVTLPYNETHCEQKDVAKQAENRWDCGPPGYGAAGCRVGAVG
ncbi:MAG: hypothetical protein WCB58_09265 [Acidobacteriaceae bacterium]